MDYRLYFLEDGRIRHVVPLECESDEHAIQVVEEHRDGRDMELWQRARMVREFPAQG
jgi:hypothetical protein